MSEDTKQPEAEEDKPKKVSREELEDVAGGLKPPPPPPGPKDRKGSWQNQPKPPGSGPGGRG